MGDGGACDGALGRASMKGGFAVPLVLVALTSCRTGGELVAAAAGGASAAATANPALGIAIGISVNASIDAGVNYFARKRQQAEQDAIASEVATMQEGDRRPWKIEHDIPIGNEHGTVEVVRSFATPLTLCKDLVFSVEQSKEPPHWYATQACQDGDVWKWSLAEPAVERWDALQ